MKNTLRPPVPSAAIPPSGAGMGVRPRRPQRNSPLAEAVDSTLLPPVWARLPEIRSGDFPTKATRIDERHSVTHDASKADPGQARFAPTPSVIVQPPVPPHLQRSATTRRQHIDPPHIETRVRPPNSATVPRVEDATPNAEWMDWAVKVIATIIAVILLAMAWKNIQRQPEPASAQENSDWPTQESVQVASRNNFRADDSPLRAGRDDSIEGDAHGRGSADVGDDRPVFLETRSAPPLSVDPLQIANPDSSKSDYPSTDPSGPHLVADEPFTDDPFGSPADTSSGLAEANQFPSTGYPDLPGTVVDSRLEKRAPPMLILAQESTTSEPDTNRLESPSLAESAGELEDMTMEFPAVDDERIPTPADPLSSPSQPKSTQDPIRLDGTIQQFLR